jgi:hypothetical protein
MLNVDAPVVVVAFIIGVASARSKEPIQVMVFLLFPLVMLTLLGR